MPNRINSVLTNKPFCAYNAEIPQYVPGAAYRQLEFLLGRIPSLETVGDYTTQTGNYTGTGHLYKD